MSTMDETIVSQIKSLDGDQSSDPHLIVIAGQHIGKLYPLEANELIAGRSPDCAIWIEDNTISRKHFRISRSGAACTITDLDSTNGTFINNKRVKTAVLQKGDKIQISKDTVIQFDYLDESRKISEQKRYEMGVKDPFTGAYNKSYFLQRLAEEFSFSLRQRQPLSIIMIDIDHFKLINDTHGHLAGDQVLQSVCALVMETIRQDDVFCRYGGEEFVTVMRNTECQPAVNLAERLRRKIEASPILYEDRPIKVTISAGVATLAGGNFRDYVALIAEGDRFLYQSKGKGRNRVSAKCMPQVTD